MLNPSQITASDADYNVENKRLKVISATPSCPLAAEQSEYQLEEDCLEADGSEKGKPQTTTIGLVLTEHLDFDAMPDPKLTCELTLTVSIPHCFLDTVFLHCVSLTFL